MRFVLKTVDRYIARYFLLNFIILFAACTGLIIMMEMVGNMDELIKAVDERGGGWRELVLAVIDFYGPKIFLYYHYMVGLLPVGAAGFTLVAMIRNREMVALLASGVSLYRIALPVFVLGFMFSGVGMAINQELIMPQLAQKLGRKVRDIRTGQLHTFELQFVPDSRGRLFVSAGYDVKSRTLRRLSILEREKTEDLDQSDPTDDRYGQATHRIEATTATWSDHRNGWELTEGRRYPLEGNAGNRLEPMPQQPYEPIDLVQTDLTPRVVLLNQRARFRMFLSVRELGRLIANPPKVVDVSELQRIRHARFSQVVINLLVLAIGIPFFLVRAPRNMFLPAVQALGICLLAWGGAIVMTQAAPKGLAPAMAAWLPVIVYLPLAYYLMDSVET